METLEYRTLDKTTWGEGPWSDEPDNPAFPRIALGDPPAWARDAYRDIGYVTDEVTHLAAQLKAMG